MAKHRAAEKPPKSGASRAFTAGADELARRGVQKAPPRPGGL